MTVVVDGQAQPLNPSARASAGDAPEPLLSAVIATLEEGRHIGTVLEQLVAQDLPDALEILVVDGGSADGTADIARDVAARLGRPDRCIRVLHNPHRRIPFAWNIGIAAATGRYVAILGAHADYPPHVLRACLDAVRASDRPCAASPRITARPGADTVEARLVLEAMTSPFGSSRRSFRTHGAGAVDSVAFPVVERDVLVRVAATTSGSYETRTTI